MLGWPEWVDDKQPVWAFSPPSPEHPMSRLFLDDRDILQQRLFSLALCNSMDECCMQLKLLGASYYADVEGCPAARIAGLTTGRTVDNTTGRISRNLPHIGSAPQ